MDFTTKKNKAYFLIIILIFIIGIALRIGAFICNSYYIPIDECHSLYSIDIISFKELLFTFVEGSNFLPGYKILQKIIYSLSGFNFLFFKLPSLIIGISSLFLFYSVINKIFIRKTIIIGALILFAVNYNLIYYSTLIKPYIFDTFITLFLLNSALIITKKYTNQDITVKKLIKYIFWGILCCFMSLTSIVIVELYWGLIFIIMFLYRKKNLVSTILFQVFISAFIAFEYFTYIKQMHTDNNLKEQWLTNGFYFSPSSLDAINSLIHYSHFSFYWFDKDLSFHFNAPIIIIYLIIFFLGVITFLLPVFKKEHDFKGLFIITPVITFVILSFCNLYPFCNRLIIFLIPIFLIIELRIFDTASKKLSILANIIFFIILCFYAKYSIQINQLIPYSMNNQMSKKTYNIIKELNYNDNNKLIISSEPVCSYCLDNKNIIYINNNLSEINTSTIKIYAANKYNQTFSVITSIQEFLNNKNKVIYLYSKINDTENSTQIIKNSIIQQGYNLEKEDSVYLYDYIIFNKID